MNPYNGEDLVSFVGHAARVKSVACSADGKNLFSGAVNGNICAWDIESGRRIAQLSAHDDSILALALLKNNTLVAASNDCSVSVWDLRTMSHLQTLPFDSPIIDLLEVGKRLLLEDINRRVHVFENQCLD